MNARGNEVYKGNEADRGRSMIKTSKRIGSRKVYAVGMTGLILLLLFSFFVPQLIFQLRDIYLCRDIVLEEQENTDVTLLGASYEPSLGQRMKTFSEGLERGRNYFVSSQDMPVSQENYEKLKTFYQMDILEVMIEIGVISNTVENGFTVNQWKQYVIYSDEYTEGVNFIIWYLDLELSGERRLELLMDAEDGTLYGAYAERNTLLSAVQVEKWAIRLDKDLIMYFDMAGINLGSWWYYVNYYYQSLTRDELNAYIDMRSNVSQVDKYAQQNDNGTSAAQSPEEFLNSGRALDFPDSNTLTLHLWFSGMSIDFSICLYKDRKEDIIDEETVFYLYPDVYMGIDPICRMIPEFAERF